MKICNEMSENEIEFNRHMKLFQFLLNVVHIEITLKTNPVHDLIKII
jgi:hypothetical protein